MSDTLPVDQAAMTQAQLESMEADAHLGTVSLPRITAQQRHYVAARVSGMGVSASAAECGCGVSTAHKWEKEPKIQAHVDHYLQVYSEKVLPRVRFSIEQAHMMYMEAFHSAGTSAEMTRATDSLVKLHGLLDRKPDGSDRGLPANAKQLESLGTQDLLRLAAIGMDTLRPGEVYDAEVDDAEEG